MELEYFYSDIYETIKNNIILAYFETEPVKLFICRTSLFPNVSKTKIYNALDRYCIKHELIQGTHKGIYFVVDTSDEYTYIKNAVDSSKNLHLKNRHFINSYRLKQVQLLLTLNGITYPLSLYTLCYILDHCFEKLETGIIDFDVCLDDNFNVKKPSTEFYFIVNDIFKSDILIYMNEMNPEYKIRNKDLWNGIKYSVRLLHEMGLLKREDSGLYQVTDKFISLIDLKHNLAQEIYNYNIIEIQLINRSISGLSGFFGHYGSPIDERNYEAIWNEMVTVLLKLHHIKATGIPFKIFNYICKKNISKDLQVIGRMKKDLGIKKAHMYRVLKLLADKGLIQNVLFYVMNEKLVENMRTLMRQMEGNNLNEARISVDAETLTYKDMIIY